MNDLSEADDIRISTTRVVPGSPQLLVPYEPRRVAIYFTTDDPAQTPLVWIQSGILKLGAGFRWINVPLVFRLPDDGALVTSEWYGAGLGFSNVTILELLARPGVNTQAAQVSPGKCYRLRAGQWEELVNGAFPGSGDGTGQ